MSLTPAALADRAGITDALNAYAQGVDQRDWDLYRSAFATDATVDALIDGTGPRSPERFRDELVDAFDDIRLSGQHVLSNTIFRIDGDTAHTVTEFLATTLERVRDQPTLVACLHAAGLYVDDLVRTPDGWRITRRVLALKSFEERRQTYAGPLAEAFRTTSTTPWTHRLRSATA
ncbi:nuclear transport factor 2 family protein [Micromonospora sp. NPDC000316]|uniref:nuclear transport factor 2 family protein n=1 Tax=Micromonospora sp. NPDC000316 TaxID=3364216 RepID=UPI0036ABDAD6